MSPLTRILFAASLFPLVADASPPSHSPDQRLIAYVAGSEKQPVIAVEKLTAINYAFAHIVDGAPVLDESGAGEVLRRLHALKMRNPKLKILASIGGWGADGFSDAAATDASRALFAQGVEDLVVKHGLDGIDLDWE